MSDGRGVLDLKSGKYVPVKHGDQRRGHKEVYANPARPANKHARIAPSSSSHTTQSLQRPVDPTLDLSGGYYDDLSLGANYTSTMGSGSNSYAAQNPYQDVNPPSHASRGHYPNSSGGHGVPASMHVHESSYPSPHPRTEHNPTTHSSQGYYHNPPGGQDYPSGMRPQRSAYPPRHPESESHPARLGSRGFYDDPSLSGVTTAMENASINPTSGSSRGGQHMPPPPPPWHTASVNPTPGLGPLEHQRYLKRLDEQARSFDNELRYQQASDKETMNAARQGVADAWSYEVDRHAQSIANNAAKAAQKAEKERKRLQVETAKIEKRQRRAANEEGQNRTRARDWRHLERSQLEAAEVFAAEKREKETRKKPERRQRAETEPKRSGPLPMSQWPPERILRQAAEDDRRTHTTRFTTAQKLRDQMPGRSEEH